MWDGVSAIGGWISRAEGSKRQWIPSVSVRERGRRCDQVTAAGGCAAVEAHVTTAAAAVAASRAAAGEDDASPEAGTASRCVGEGEWYHRDGESEGKGEGERRRLQRGEKSRPSDGMSQRRRKN